MFKLYLIQLLARFIISTKRKHIDQLCEKKFYDQKLSYMFIKEDFDFSKNFNYINFRCKKTTSLQNSVEKLNNINLEDTLCYDLNKFNCENSKQYNLLLSILMNNVVISSVYTFELDYDIICKSCEDFLTEKKGKFYDVYSKTYINDVIRKIDSYYGNLNKNLHFNLHEKKLINYNEHLIYYNKYLRLEIKQYHINWINTNIKTEHDYEEKDFFNKLQYLKFFSNKLLNSFFKTNLCKFRENLTYATIKKDIKSLFVSIFYENKLLYNKIEGEIFFDLIKNSNLDTQNNKDSFNFKKNFFYENTNAMCLLRANFVSLNEFTKIKYCKYTVNLTLENVDKFLHLSKNLYDVLYSKNVNISSKQSIYYILKQISDIEELHIQIAFYLTFFKALLLNFRIKTSIIRIFLLLKIYQNFEHINKKEVDFQINLWYYLICCINYNIDIDTYEVLKKNTVFLLDSNYEFSNVINFLEYFNYTLFSLTNNSLKKNFSFEKYIKNEELIMDNNIFKASQLFTNFVLKIIFENNLI